METSIAMQQATSDDDLEGDQGEEELSDSDDDDYNKRFVPVSELPRIPKKKPQLEVIVIDDDESSPSPHKSVLERVNVPHDGYKSVPIYLCSQR